MNYDGVLKQIASIVSLWVKNRSNAFIARGKSVEALGEEFDRMRRQKKEFDRMYLLQGDASP